METVPMKNNQMIIETQRTYLREFTVADIIDAQEIYGDPDVMKFIGDGSAYTKDQIEIFIEKMKKRYIRDGYSFWAVILKKTNHLIGHAGFLATNSNHVAESGYTLKKQYWNQGLGYETAVASRDYGFQQMTLKRIIAKAKTKNLRSIDLMKKIGMKQIDEYESDGIHRVIYEQKKQDWIESEGI
jgi:ribosomal-protein-alanine N-acetyltransferase